MDREELKKILPHREPMLLLDKCEKTGEKTCRGEYTVKGDEFFLQGHFPDYPVVPGVILCEIMAQSSCMLFLEDMEGATPLYAGIKNVKFKNSVFPKDTVIIENEVIAVKKPFYMVRSTAIVNDKIAVTGELTFYLFKKQQNN